MKKTMARLLSVIFPLLFLFAATISYAANGVWNGTVDALWTNSNNWSASPYPSGTDTALFNNAGSGQTTLDLSGLTSITYMTYDSASVAAYTNGTGAANSQTLVLADNGIITLTATAANSPVFNAGLQLGTTTAAGTYTLINSNTAQTLTFNNVVGAPSGGTAGVKNVAVNGAGDVTILGNMNKGGATSLTLMNNNTGTLTLAGTNSFSAITLASSGALVLSGSNLVTTLNMNGAGNVVTVNDGILALNNGGSATLASTQGGTINGSGTIWLSGNSGGYADNYVALGKTLTINTAITSAGGFEFWGPTPPYGTFVLNATNTFQLDVLFNQPGTISAWKIGNKGSTTSNLGKGTNINFNATTGVAELIYTGSGEESDRILQLNYNATIEHAGTGLLKFTAPLTASGNAKTFTLDGSTSGVGEIAGVIPVGSGTTTALAKNGTGTWILSAANTYAGVTTVNGGILILTGTNGVINASTGYTINTGGTLLLENSSTANNTNRLRDASTLTMNGGTLCITNNGGSVNYRENAGTLAITPGGNSTIMTVEAAGGQSNILTFTALSYTGGKLNFVGTGLGASDQNRIFIAGVTNGLMGSWATVNGTSYAAYDSTLGVYAATSEPAITDIAAEGGVAESVIPDNGALWARINLPGLSGPITLQGEWTNSIGYIIQNTTTNTTIATFDGVTNKLLRAAGLSIAEGKAELKVGENANDGSLSALTAGGTLVLDNNSSGNALIVNAPIVNNTSASALSKIGAGTVVLNGTNTYSGNTAITEGTLTFAGGSSQTVAGTTTINNNGTLDFSGSAVQTVAGIISGAGMVTRSGTGTLNLNAANTFTGGLKINEGTVTTALANGLGVGSVTNNGILNLTGGALTYTGLSTGLAGTGTNNVTLGTGSTATAILNGNYSEFTGVWNIGVGRVATQSKAQMNGLDNSAAKINILSNATLYSVGAVTHNATLVLEGGNTYESLGQLRLDTGASWAGPITLIGPITDAADAFFGNGAASTISGVIDDLGNGFTVDKLSAGTLTFSGPNTYSGPTWVKAGAISVPAMGTISGGASPLGSQTSAAAGKVRLGNGGTATTLIYTGAGETSDRMIDLAGTTGGAILDQSGTGALAITGGMMISGTGAKTLTLQGSTTGTAEFAGAITNGAGSTVAVTKTGTGTWTLSGTNDYSGATTISAGTLNVSGSITNSAVTVSGGVLDISGTIGNGGVAISSGTGAKVIARGATALGTGAMLFNTGATTPRLEMKIDGSGPIALPNRIGGNSGLVDTIDVDNNGSGTGGVIQFNGLNSDFGSTTINVTGANGYSLFIKNLRDTAGNSGTMTLNPTTANLGIETISGSATGANNYTIALDGTSTGNTITGTISNKSNSGATTIAITKTNSSTWTLTGECIYTGATLVNGGTLLVNAPGSLGAGSAVTVNKGGILGGNGTINGLVTANAGGCLAPGGLNNVDTFNLSSNLTLNGGTLAFDLSSVATDKVAVAGALIVNNANIVDLALVGGTLAEGTYTLMTYASMSGSGLFTLAHAYPNATLTAGSTSLTLTVGAGGMGYGMIWKGNSSVNWDDTAPNWEIDGTATNFVTGDAVTFDDTASAFTVGSIGTVLPSYVVFNNANPYTISATIDGTSPFVKLGAGITALTGLSTYNPSSVAVNAGTLTLGGSSQLNSGLYAGPIFNESLFNFASTATQTNSGSMMGVGSLIQSGSGTLVLSGSNTFSGTVTVNAGSVLSIQNGFALGVTNAGTIVAAGGTLEMLGSIATPVEALNLAGTLSSPTGSNIYAGAITFQPGAVFNVGLGSTNYISAATVANGNGFTKMGLGTLRLTADPAQNGPFVVNEGVLELFHSGATDAPFIISPGAILRNLDADSMGDAYAFTNNGTFDIRVNDTISTLIGNGLITIGSAASVTLTVGADNKVGTFSGVIEDGAGKLTLTKSGTGTQILSGVNTYTGLTSVTGGTLLINGSTATNSAVTVNLSCALGGAGTIYGSVNMASGSTLLPGSLSAIGTLTLANSSAAALTLNGSILRADLSNVSGECDLVALTDAAGTLVLNGLNIVQLNFLNGSAPAGDYTLMTFNNRTGSGSFALASGYANTSLELTANSLVLHVTGSGTSAGLSWKGNISGVWDNGILNWTNGTASVAYTAGAAVTFDDTASGNLIVSSVGAVTPGSVYYNNNVSVYTNAANITGTGSLVKMGSAALTLSGITTYNPAFIDLSSSTVTLSGSSKLNNGSYAGNINNNGTLNYISSSAQTLSGILSGPGALIKDSASTMTLSGTNTYTGATTVRGGGTLKILNDSALGTTGNGTTVTNATLELAGNITTPAEGLTLYGTLSSQTGTNTYGGTVTTAGGASVINVGAGSMLILKGSQANGAYTKDGAGWLKLTVDPNGAGVMTINNGVAELAQATGSTESDIVVNNGATLLESIGLINDNNKVTVNAGGIYDLRLSDTIASLNGAGLVTKGTIGASILTVGGNNGSGTFSGVIENGLGTLAFTKAGTGTQTLSGINTFSGNMSIAGTLLLTGAGQLGNGLYAGTIVNTGLLVYDSTATQTLSGVISGAAGAIRKTGTGTLVLSAINTYTGATSISNGVLLGITGGNCTNSAVTLQSNGSGATATLGVRYVGSNTKWSCASLTTVAAVSSGNAPNLLFAFNVLPTTNVVYVSGNVVFDASTTITVAPANLVAGDYPLLIAGGTVPAVTPAVTIGRGLTGTVSWGKAPFSAKTLVLTVSGTSTEPLKWNQPNSGTWNINVGTNTVWKDNAGVSTNYQESSLIGDQVVFDDTVSADTVVTLNSIVNPATVTFSNAVRQYTVSGSGSIAGFVDLAKSGIGTVTLATANTYLGVTTLSGGMLKLGNTWALPTNNTAALSGTGTLDLNGFAPVIANISSSVAGNTITDTSAGTGTTALSLLNQAATVSATIKDGASKAVAVNLANANLGVAAFALNTSNTFSGALTLKNTSSGTRLIVNNPVITVGTPGNITSSPFGRGPITIGEAATDKAGIYISTSANNTIANDLTVNTTNGTDQIYALRVDTTGISMNGKVKANSDLTIGAQGTNTGSVTLTNEVSGAGGVRLVSSGTALTVNLFGPNTYKGKTTLPSGSTLAFNSIGNVGSGASALGAPDTVAAGTITVGNGTTTGMTLLYRGMGHTTDRVLELAGTTGGLTINHSGTNLLKFTSDLLMSGSGAKRFALTGANNSTGEVAGVISDNAGGKLNLYKDTTASTWILSGTNTFTDTVNINAGKLIIKNSFALGLGNKTVIINQGSSGNPQLYLDGSDGPITLGTNLTFQTSNNTSGSLHNTKGTNSIQGNITMTGGGGDTIITSWADKLYISGNVTPNTAVRNLHLRGNGDGELSGVIANGVTTNMPVFKESGTGTWTFSGINTYSGPTTISSGMMIAASDQAFGVSNVVSLAGGNLGGADGTWAITNTVSVQNKADIVTAGTLILSGMITNTAALNKTGSGTLLLNGSSIGTGPLTVSAGVLGGRGLFSGTVTNLATITAADTNSIGTLTVSNLVIGAGSTIAWNCNATTQDMINVTGTLTLPSAATVTVSEETVGDLGFTPRVLFTFASGPAPTRLTGWTVVGAPQGTFVYVDSNRVVLHCPPRGTMISVF